MNKKFTTSQITLLGLMIAILLLMAYTPLGYLNIGPLAITFNIIPVAISAITMGPVGGAIAGAVFGLTSFGQCIGIGGTSLMGVMGLLVGLFGNTEYVQGLMGGKNVILFICTFVGINAVCEMLSATVITGAVGAALYKARLLPGTEKKSEKVVKTAEV